MSVKLSTFQKDGKTFPIIELKHKDEDKYGLSVGVSKARLILNNLDALRQFVDKNGR